MPARATGKTTSVTIAKPQPIADPLQTQPVWLKDFFEASTALGSRIFFVDPKRIHNVAPSDWEAARRFANAVDQVDSITPKTGDAAKVQVTSTLLAIRSVYFPRDMSEAERVAWGEAYGAALGDVPVWAIDEAARRWHRGECGKDEHGEPYQYRFGPKPAELRRIAAGIAAMARFQAKVVRHFLERL